MNFTINNEIVWKTCVLYDTEFKRLVGSPSKSYFINLVFVCIANILLTVSTIFLNTITILACWKSKELRKKKSYFLIALLSSNDLMMGVLGSPSVVALMVKTLMQNCECATFILFELTASGLIAISFMTLFLLNLERYLSIVRPFFHRNKVTKLRLFGIALVLWSLALLLTFSRLFVDTAARYIRTIAIIIIVILVVCMYMSIIHTCRKTAQRCRSQHELRNQTARNIQDLKLAKSCAIVVCCSIICFIPFSVTSFLRPQGNIVVFAVAFWSNTLAIAGSSINSVIFFWRNRVLRNQAKRILNCQA